MMNNSIYAVMYSYYSDWQIYGYFTNKDDAEKYCVAHPKQELYVMEIPCYDNNSEKLKDIRLKYEFKITFIKEEETGEYILKDESENPSYSYYQAEFLKSNQIVTSGFRDNWMRICVNLTERNIYKAQKIALDIYYQYKDFCNCNVASMLDVLNINEFNKLLAKDELERKQLEEEEKLRQKELKELERLKKKYENE